MAKSTNQMRRRVLSLAAASLLALAGCSSNGSGTGRTPGGDTASSGARTWDETLACAKKENTVTWYTSNVETIIKPTIAAFTAKYGITVKPYYAVDSDTSQHVDAEFKTGKHEADMVTTTTGVYYQTLAKAGNVVPLAGPSFDNPKLVEGAVSSEGWFQVNAPTFALAWNSSLVMKDLTSYKDLLDSSLGGGKIGVNDPSVSPTITNAWLWLDKNYGADFQTQLSKQKPRVYKSQVPMTQALGSGEISVALFDSPSLVVPAQNSGAPLKYVFVKDVSTQAGAHFYSAILNGAPHPCAAQVLADWLVTAEGQGYIAKFTGSVLPDIATSPTTLDKVEQADATKVTPAFVGTFYDAWKQKFL